MIIALLWEGADRVPMVVKERKWFLEQGRVVLRVGGVSRKGKEERLTSQSSSYKFAIQCTLHYQWPWLGSGEYFVGAVGHSRPLLCIRQHQYLPTTFLLTCHSETQWILLNVLHSDFFSFTSIFVAKEQWSEIYVFHISYNHSFWICPLQTELFFLETWIFCFCLAKKEGGWWWEHKSLSLSISLSQRSIIVHHVAFSRWHPAHCCWLC